VAWGPPGPGQAPARQGERLRAVASRLRSLNPAAPLRRSLAAAIGDLQAAGQGRSAIVLSHLVAPTAECLSRRLADAVQAAARAARIKPA
jgi:hypothetical protein